MKRLALFGLSTIAPAVDLTLQIDGRAQKQSLATSDYSLTSGHLHVVSFAVSVDRPQKLGRYMSAVVAQ